MNKKRQREIAYIKLNKVGTGYAIAAQPSHVESLAEHFQHKAVSFVKLRKGGTEDLLEFPGGKDGEHLERILKEWKEKFVSGGGQYW